MDDLKSKRAYWVPDSDVRPLLDTRDLTELNKDQLVSIIRDLDRRFIQLWDKVQYENTH